VADFILMLTHRDVTVPDCLAAFESVKDLGLKHVGFKDMGADFETLERLNAAIKATGATSYIEVVSSEPQAIQISIASGKRLGVDRVLGGKEIAFAADNGIPYYPFAGTASGHPTVLSGAPGEIEADCAAARRAGCPGVDLLAYRATERNAVELMQAARRGLGPEGHLIVAGGIDSPRRIEEATRAGANAFTIGSALFEGVFAPGVEGLRGQCEAVLRAIGL
jgi:hypothetical protein